MSDNGGNSKIELLLQDLANPFAGQVQTKSIFVALGLSVGTMILIAITFSLVRPHHNAVYAPKIKHADKRRSPPPIGKGVFAWVDPVVKTKEMDLVDKIGMDGAVFMRCTLMLRNIMFFLTVIGCGILIPVHIKYSGEFGQNGATKRQSDNNAADQSTYLYKLTPKSVMGPPMWAHVIFMYIADVVVMYFLWSNYKAIVRLRRAYFESEDYQNSVHGRSLMVTDIARANRTDEGVLKIVDSVTAVASIPKTAIARNMKELPDLLEEHEKAVRKLEVVLAKYLKNPDKLPLSRPVMRDSGKGHAKVDAIDHLTSLIQELETRIRDTRATIDKRNAEPYGFATYGSISDAHEVAWASRGKHPQGSTISLSPSPKDIIWKNLRLSKQARGRKRFTANLWVALLTGLYIIPNAFIAIFLTNLANLAQFWPAFTPVYNGNPNLWAVVQAILAPALFSLFYLILPTIFRRISTQSGDRTKTSRERHVIHKLYAFFVFNNLIVFSIFSAVWEFVASLISAANSQDFWQQVQGEVKLLPGIFLATICNVSPFWITWLLQRNLGAAIDLVQIVNMTFQWYKRHLMAPTPREIIEATAPPPFDYASYYNYFLYYVTVATCFSTIQPIVLPITFLYFAVDAWLKKYLLLYVFITKTESGGMFWNVVHNRMLFATLLQNVIGALVILGAQGGWIMIATMAPLPLILLGFKIWISKTLANQARYYTRALLPAADAETLSDPKKNVKHVSSRLMNPVMTKPLMTPMVHAKAQHMLAEIYHGRLDDYASASGYGGDVPMADMHSGQPGQKAAAGIANMFEVVSERDLDFAKFKNRADFRDEFGGGGELYGRPLDAMTDRSATPASFMTGDADSDDGLTRIGTPEPMPPHMQNHPAFREQQHQGPYGVNPVQGRYMAPQHLRSDSFGSVGSETGPPQRAGFYRQHSETSSARRLVGAGQPMGYAPVGSDNATPAEEVSEDQFYGMSRWQTGGQSYNPVRGDMGETNYESYRPERRY